MDNIVKFPGVEEVFSDDILGPSIPVKDALDAAMERDLDDVIILGQKDGGFYLATTTGDPKEILWELEKAKSILMSAVFNSEDLMDG